MNAPGAGDWRATLTVWGEAIAIFIMAVMLILLGFYLMIPNQAEGGI